ncbi:16S rRNA (guanine(527)-N(7))-methyltransferase RsmG [Hydrogenimonas thermophila]|uniref:16S rRNA (guanine(527)-N(7))-methyltransferase RsmG n=1 Tax=Hydrogenimonas thermophila TaxID=223786 RepID=UPI002936F8F7|nr:16S rRNA (guanine(527)-N(7))-methyltransferase RsmG [Hydrogenimonas thermophila]WOE69492.1 16S rRNA (guanine(527)-N(7))-methyltransferase RsmG [Hydrogenimonas thermophila]WOE72003.1 16S rRNA (guanine(527)-N(7))-methyltransferase RsmG [Hydrogenimonas thermophila]
MKKLKLPDEVYKKLDSFTKSLMDWNKVHNLTGAKTYEAIDEQIYDSIYPLTFLSKQNSLLDIGTGAGFPGMILAIAMPETECTLCEPLRKRASFLKFIVRELELTNVTVEANRVEDLEVRPYDLITSRAVTDTKTLIEWSRPFIGENTQMLFYKGEQVFEEVKGLESCKYELISRDQRNYLWIKKLGVS